MRKMKTLLTVLLMGYLVSTSLWAQGEKKDSTKTKSPFKPYEKVITEEAESDQGLFTTHHIDEKLYFEIPDSILDRDMLLVSRIAQTPTKYSGFLSGGAKVHEQLIRWERKGKQLLLRTVTYNSVAADSLPIYKAVQNSNYAPIIAAFKIEAISPDSNATVINATSLYTKDIRAISPIPNYLRKRYKVKGLDTKRSFIESAHSYPINVEVKHSLTFSAGAAPAQANTGTLSFLMNQSMVLLPKETMTPRMFDPRVGFFTVSQVDFGSEALKADEKTFITRWRLEPKDPEAYMRGELVEPVKPIVYYLDPATPERWRPWFKKGVEDWQVCFEAAGFKNAIICKYPPTPEEDPEFSPEDARYSTIRYIANMTRNAMGPSVKDPRSGEIIESDILWFHNHLRSYRNRYLIETAAANPRARTLDLPEEDIGEMIRAVIAHEVGHTLGFPHNFKSSSAYPIDSLRNGPFTHKNGISPSIMDYARVNYIAQRGDEGIRFIRKVGPYDTYAVNWGYRWLPNIDKPEQEKDSLDNWILAKAGDPVYAFGDYGKGDPRYNRESLGDNMVEASRLGLTNLRYVAAHLVDWTTQPGEDYTDLKEVYRELTFQWRRYAFHVVDVVGGIKRDVKNTDQEGYVYEPISEEWQEDAMQFLVQEVFRTPRWISTPKITNYIQGEGTQNMMRMLQISALRSLTSDTRLNRMMDVSETGRRMGMKVYTVHELMEDLRLGLFAEIIPEGNKKFFDGKTLPALDVYRRNLQFAYIQRLMDLVEEGYEQPSDASAAAFLQLRTLRKSVKKARRSEFAQNEAHWRMCYRLIKDYKK
ncbi:MAG: zinc-dependent metalloprotease [Bacteroidota bacterium]